MANRPVAFSDLIARIAGLAADQQSPRPLVGRLMELGGSRRVRTPDGWVVLHSVTSSGAYLIHARPFQSPQVVVELDAPQGAVLSVILQVLESHAAGELIETAVGFFNQQAPRLQSLHEARLANRSAEQI